jgi:CheY-like chemotaxis protein
MELDPSSELQEHLQGIEAYIKNATDLTRQLLGFARGGKYEVVPTDLNELLKHSAEMFGRTKREVRIHTKCREGLWTVNVDRLQIEQVLLNLFVNAWQAMPEGGDLYLQTENAMLQSSDLRLLNREAGHCVKVSVSDTGIGMDEATQQRIFEPFFTTKTMGRGTGLGLASAYGIIENHGGFIRVHSELGKGATFSIFLPAVPESPPVEAKEDVAGEIRKGRETVLLVDDEAMVLEVGKAMLAKLGYRVLEAADGREALDLMSRHEGEVRLVILDMIMPGMSGSETYDRLHALHPRVRVLLSSGYSLNGQAQEIMERGCDGFIQKPFNVQDLAAKVRSMLDRP